MNPLENWLRGVEASLRGNLELRDLGIADVAGVRDAVACSLDGFLGVLPLWRGPRTTVGVMALPQVAFSEWPGVILQDGQGLTVASSARTLLPQYIVQRVLSNVPETTAVVAKRWSAIKEERALELHRALGGHDDTLRAVTTVFRDVELRNAFRYVTGRDSEFEAAHSRLCRAIDSSVQFTAYADWLDGCIVGHCSAGDVSAYGPWRRRVLCWTERLRLAGYTMDELPTRAIVSIIEERAGIDSALPTEPSWSVHPGGASATTALIEAAMDLQHRSDGLDTVSAALVRALTGEDEEYRGLAHAEAAVALDEGGDALRAWGALQSAAWWAARNAEVPKAMFDGAQAMAARHGWTDVRWVVERAMDQ